MKRASTLLPIVSFLTLIACGSAKADPILDFGVMAPTGGAIFYTGGLNPLTGAGITVDNVVGMGVPSNDGTTLDLFNAHLDFMTGPATGAWTWGGGPTSFITVVGGVDLNGDHVLDAGDLPTDTVLLVGSFDSASVQAFGSSFKIAGSVFHDQKNPELLNYFGLPGGLYDGNFNISFTGTGVLGDAFRSTSVLSGDIVNTPSPVPEPMTVLLLGGASIGFAGYSRKRNRLQAA